MTLCGLLFYRGLARGFTEDQTQGFRGGYEELRSLATGRIPVPGLTDLEAFEGASAFAIPAPVVSLLVIALVAAFLLRFTVWGRWLLASYHISLNALDNPILDMAKRSLLWVGLGAGAAGLLLGVLIARRFMG